MGLSAYIFTHSFFAFGWIGHIFALPRRKSRDLPTANEMKKILKETGKKHDKTNKICAASKYFIHLCPPRALRVPFRHACSTTPDWWLTPRGHVSLNSCRGHRYLHINMLYRIAFTQWEISYILCNVFFSLAETVYYMTDYPNISYIPHHYRWTWGRVSKALTNENI